MSEESLKLDEVREKLGEMSVLYVEDEAELRSKLEGILAHLFKEVRLACNGAEGLDAYRKEPVDMVVTDIIMPEMDGLELARKIREIDPRQTVLFLSATTDTFHFSEIVKLGSDGFILKPLSRDQLFSCLVRAADQLTARRESEAYRKELEGRVQEAVEENMRKTRMLEHQSRLAQMGEMLGVVAHQWKQPINVIGLTMDDLLEEHRFGGLTEEYMEGAAAQIHEQLGQMTGIIEDFRRFYNPDGPVERFRLSTAAEETLRLMGSQFRHLEIEVDIRIHTDVEWTGRENEIRQVLLNFITNAKENFLERKVEAPKIRIAVEEREGMGRIAVADNGGGVPPEAAARLFEPYFTTKAKGSGIGLYISRLIAEKYRGRVGWENLEEGASFYLELPLA